MLKHLTIIIAGAPREGKNIDLFEQHILEKIGKVADDPQSERYNFAQIHYRFIFTAVKLDITKIDTLHNQTVRLASTYLSKWQYSINIKYTETWED